jgi:hypothetical protein
LEYRWRDYPWRIRGVVEKAFLSRHSDSFSIL